jgi:hypothetical protein
MFLGQDIFLAVGKPAWDMGKRSISEKSNSLVPALRGLVLAGHIPAFRESHVAGNHFLGQWHLLLDVLSAAKMWPVPLSFDILRFMSQISSWALGPLLMDA